VVCGAVLKVFLFLSLVANRQQFRCPRSPRFSAAPSHTPFAARRHLSSCSSRGHARRTAARECPYVARSCNDAFRGAAHLVRKTVKVFFAYAIVNFIVFIITRPAKPPLVK